MKFMRTVKLVFSCLLFMLICESCSRNKTAEPFSDRDGNLIFSWWGKDFRHEYTLKGLEEFKKLYPTVNILPVYASWKGYEKAFDVYFRTGNSADVMQINYDWLYKYSSDGKGFYNLNLLSDYIDFSNYTLDDLSYGTICGSLNAIPVAFNAAMPIFDKTLFERNGLDVPDTWDDLFKAAKVLSKKNTYILGADSKHTFILLVAWFEQKNSKRIFIDTDKISLTAEEIGQMFDFYKTLSEKKILYPDFLNFDADSLKKDNIAGAFVWCNESSLYADVYEERGDEACLDSYIKMDGAIETGWYLKPSMMYAINKDCNNVEEAAKLVNFLVNNPTMALLQKCEKGVPASNVSLMTLMENNELSSMQYNSLMKIRFNRERINSMPPLMENSELITTFMENVSAFTGGTKDKDSAIDSVLEKIKAIAKIL